MTEGVQLYDIRKCELDDDIERVAYLLYKGFILYRYGEMDSTEEEEVINNFSKLIKMEHNEFSYRNIWICINENEEIMAILLGYKPSSVDEKLAIKELASVKKIPFYKSKYRDYRSELSPMEDKYASAFMHVVSVDPKFRGIGVGTALIDEFSNYCQNYLHCTHIYIDVRLECKVTIDFLKKRKFVAKRVLERDIANECPICVRLVKNF